jgi:hypothetical protein
LNESFGRNAHELTVLGDIDINGHRRWTKALPSVKKGCRGIVAFNPMKCNKALYGDRRKINLVQLDGV